MSDQSELQVDLHGSLQRAMTAAGPYPPEAFHFVREGLSFTADRAHGALEGEIDPMELDRHVSGQELCIGLRDYAIERYGYLAPTVFSHWNVRRTDDFGRIVFALIEGGLLSKTDDDTMEDFRGVFDFAEAFAEDQLRGRIGVG